MSSLQNSIVEYTGHFPGRLMHGNASKHTQTYIRTKMSTMKEMSKILLHNKPKKVYTDFLLQEDIEHAPRHSRQVRQNKSYDNKKTNEDKLGTPKTRNLADNILTILNMAKEENLFVRSVVCDSNKIPSFILCNGRHLRDVKQFCVDGKNDSV